VPVAPRTWLLLAVVMWSLLGLGERCLVDPRFISPSSTLTTYWDGLRAGDEGAVEDCFVAGKHDLPFPGMLWFLPPTSEFALTDFRSLPVMSGRVMVTYEVHYRAEGSSQDQVFRTGNELVRERGEWRIARPIGEASMPQWKPIPRAVDS